MAFTIETQIGIKASPTKVWNILMDFENYPKWNPFIKSIKGDIKVGNVIQVELGNMRFTPKVLACTPKQEFRWLGKLWIGGIFDGEHIFLLQEQKDGSTLFTHKENFKGLLVPLLKKKLNNETKEDFNRMNQALKVQAESN